MLEVFNGGSKHRDHYIWTASSVEREKKGQCFSGLVIEREVKLNDGKLQYKFRRKKGHFNASQPLLHVPIIAGDRVIVSEEGKCTFNITTGKR